MYLSKLTNRVVIVQFTRIYSYFQERVKKLQERQALKAQKQKELEEERTKAKKEKEEKIKQYKKKRLEKTKALSKKTHRGQPLMKDRMQLLLKQIEQMKKNG